MSRRNLTLAIVIVLVVLIGAGAFYFWQQSNAQRAAAATATRQTGTLSRGPLSASVSGAGNITAPEQSNLSFGVSGVAVTKVNVKVGDIVKQGDVLAEADATQLNEQLRSAQASLASAQAAYDDLKAPATSDEIALAQAQIKGAQASYDAAVANLAKLKAPPAALDLQADRAQVASAQAAYDTAAAKAKMTADQITVQRAALDTALINLQAAQAAYDAVAWQSNVTSSSAAKTLQTATIAYESAQATYNLSATEMTDQAVQTAAAALAQAKQNLATLTAGATPDQLATAQASVDSASQNLLSAQQNLTTVQAGATQKDLLAAQASVETATNAVAQAKRALDGAKLIAPINGTVAAVNTFVGQTTATATNAITLVNTQDLQIVVQLSEVDVAAIKPGQAVQLTFDALTGKNIDGKVSAVSPLGTTSQGVVNYNVTILITSPDPAILPGMTAQATIITQQVQDALIAPNRAIRSQGNRRLMTLLFEGKEIPIIVQTGLTGETGTQILSAATSDGQPVQLQDGDTVVLNTTTSTTGGGGGPGGFIGGPGGFGRVP